MEAHCSREGILHLKQQKKIFFDPFCYLCFMFVFIMLFCANLVEGIMRNNSVKLF